MLPAEAASRLGRLKFDPIITNHLYFLSFFDNYATENPSRKQPVEMIGDLFKRLHVGLWRFVRSERAGLTGSNSTSPAPLVTENPKPPTGVDGAGRKDPPPDEAILFDSYRRPLRLSTSGRDLDGQDLAHNPVFQLWKQHEPRAFKWTHYFEAYHAIFGVRRPQALRILEIGVYQGASLHLWRRYFDNPESVIVGIDIEPTCARFDSPSENVHVRIGSQADAAFLETIKREFGPFDIIVDDGSHHSSHMIASFNHLFADGLKDDGIYLVEDLHSNYWFPWRDTRNSFLDLCKHLMEFMHAHYMRATLNDWMRECESVSKPDPLSLDVPIIASMIKEIRIFDSIVAIHKTRREYLPRMLNPSTD
jgi:hypothetical protein